MSTGSQAASTAGTGHVWRFFRAGGFDQVRLDSGADYVNLGQLDQKLWTALACPTKGLEFDQRTLDLIDTDKDGRIRAPELMAAVKWTVGLLRNPNDLVKGAEALPLASINDAVPEGKQLLAAARQVLDHLGRKEAGSVTVAETADTAKVFAQTKFNGDGVVVAESAEDAAVAAVIADIVSSLGGELDRSGKPGVSQAKTDAFFAELQACSDWRKQAESEPAVVMPLGENTGAALAAVRAVAVKVDDFFARCRLAAFDARALAAVNREEKDYLALAAKDLTITSAEIAALPVARVAAGAALPLKEGLNPAWEGAVLKLASDAVKPLIGDRVVLTEAEWGQVKARLAPHEAWLGSKAGAGVEKLGLARVREILSGKSKEAIGALIAKDKALEAEFAAMATLDKLVRFHQYLSRLVINFVNFKDFYDRGEPAVFQAGVLYLDQRSCTLCLTVEDAGRHATMAGLAGTYLVYCDCVRKGTGEKLQIVAGITDGDSDNLMVGRNGVFYDRKGRDWDATITKIIDNPISLRQAFWSPYKKLVRMIEEQVAKRAAAAEAASTAKLEQTAAKVATADKSAPAPAKPGEPPKKVDVGTVAALGVAFGALATAFAAIAGYLSGLLKLPFWQVCLAVAGLMMLVSGPSMLIAFLKLRKRNLGPILDANGWAVNSRARVNVPFGTALTGVAQLPPGAQVAGDDPFGEKPSAWPRFVAFMVAVCFLFSLLNHFGAIHWMSGGKFGHDPKAEQRKEERAKAEEKAKSEKGATALTSTAVVPAAPATNAPAAP